MPVYKMFRFSWIRAVTSACLLLILVTIALFVHDQFIRPFVGEVLAVIWVYFCVTSLISCNALKASIGVFLFAVTIEVCQYINILALLGLEHDRLLRIVFGSTFDWLDILAYFLGAASCFMIEKIQNPKNQKTIKSLVTNS